jgi:hypothetical protein
MNILINHFQFDTNNTFFMDKKKNIIVNGSFSRLLYSNSFFVMNGLHFEFPIVDYRIINTNQNSELVFSPYKDSNMSYVSDFVKIENSLLTNYKMIYGINKSVSAVLSKQLHSGNMKLYRNLHKKKMNPTQLVIKISGIWETDNEIGLATKLLCY